MLRRQERGGVKVHEQMMVRLRLIFRPAAVSRMIDNGVLAVFVRSVYNMGTVGIREIGRYGWYDV